MSNNFLSVGYRFIELRKDLSQNNFILKLIYKISFVDHVKIQELLVF